MKCVLEDHKNSFRFFGLVSFSQRNEGATAPAKTNEKVHFRCGIP